jgi:Protein kinase domain
MPELPLVGHEFAGYRVRSVLGRGGMSLVYQAENPRLGSVIALKVLAPELATDDVFRARFLEESRIAASLNHPNVIPIYDMGSQDGLLYIAMRYVSGTDLRQMIKKRGRLLPETALFLLGQAARALDAAHRQGLVHRDAKPGNLLIERGSDDADPEHVYLTDFGITKHAMSRTGLTSTGQFLGTVDYVAPEQIRGLPLTGQADQYSLGCVLYECLTGRVPFEKDLDAAIIWAHVEETPTRPTALRPDFPPEVDGVFGRVLAKRPEERYRSCREFIDAARVALGLHPGQLAGPSYGGYMAGPPGGLPRSRAFEPLAGEPTELVAAASQDVRAYQGGSMASGRRQAGAARPHHTGEPDGHQPPPGRPGPRRSGFLRPRWLAVLAAVILLAAGAGTWALVRGGSASHAAGAGASSRSAGPKASARALMNALILANQSAEAKGDLPPSTCHQQITTKVTCSAPVAGVDHVIFQTYPSLTALYAAYLARVNSLNSGQFQANYQDCGLQQTVGEVSWNHQFHHSKSYSIAQLESGKLKDDQAAGRLYCNYENGQEDMVWTQNDGLLLGWVMGPLHEEVWQWWVAVHHNIGLSTSPMHM